MVSEYHIYYLSTYLDSPDSHIVRFPDFHPNGLSLLRLPIRPNLTSSTHISKQPFSNYVAQYRCRITLYHRS